MLNVNSLVFTPSFFPCWFFFFLSHRQNSQIFGNVNFGELRHIKQTWLVDPKSYLTYGVSYFSCLFSVLAFSTPCKFVPHFPVLHFHPSAGFCYIFMSCIFMSCVFNVPSRTHMLKSWNRKIRYCSCNFFLQTFIALCVMEQNKWSTDWMIAY